MAADDVLEGCTIPPGDGISESSCPLFRVWKVVGAVINCTGFCFLLGVLYAHMGGCHTSKCCSPPAHGLGKIKGRVILHVDVLGRPASPLSQRRFAAVPLLPMSSCLYGVPSVTFVFFRNLTRLATSELVYRFKPRRVLPCLQTTLQIPPSLLTCSLYLTTPQPPLLTCNLYLRIPQPSPLLLPFSSYDELTLRQLGVR